MKKIEVTIKFWCERNFATNKKIDKRTYRYEITILLVQMRISTLIKMDTGTRTMSRK